MTDPTDAPADYRFQVNLKDLIGILSHHLYSTHDVFLRELTQNCCDAISARRRVDAEFEPLIEFELLEGGDTPTLPVADNGCGLTAEEIHEFLATIGTSSKREEADFITTRADFIGQFGIGLLSTFMVCDEIVLLTRSHKSEQAYEWRGHSDGTYTLTESDADLTVGTRVFLRASADSADLFTGDQILERLRHYCNYLPTPIFLTWADTRKQVNEVAPWSRTCPAADSEAAAVKLAQRCFGEGQILDVFAIEGDYVSGYAFLMPFHMIGGARRNAVYIRNMFIGANLNDLMPDWACLFAIVLNSDHLTPSASREALYGDEHLAAAREEIERALNVYLRRLASDRPAVLTELILQYEPLLKNLAAQNDHFLQCIFGVLTFETSRGRLPLSEVLADPGGASFVTDVDEFHKLVPIASASGHVVINAGYAFEPVLMSKLHLLHGPKLRPMDSAALLACLKEVNDPEAAEWAETHDLLSRVLRIYGVRPRLVRFQPDTIPMLYFQGEAQREARRMQHFEEQADDLFQSVLSELSLPPDPNELLVNVENPLIQNLQACGDTGFAESVAKLLYVQSLLLGRYPLGHQELLLLNENVGALLQRTLLGD